jgi:hypothetical protein
MRCIHDHSKEISLKCLILATVGFATTANRYTNSIRLKIHVKKFIAKSLRKIQQKRDVVRHTCLLLLIKF